MLAIRFTHSQFDPAEFRQNQNHENKHQKTAKHDFIHILKHCCRADVAIARKKRQTIKIFPSLAYIMKARLRSKTAHVIT